jgi:hypothetical protein
MRASPDYPDRWFHEKILPDAAILRRWLRAKFPSPTDSNDLMPEPFSRVLPARVTSPIASPKGFPCTTSRHLVFDQARRQKISGRDARTETAAQLVFADVPAVSEIVGRREELARLTQAIQSLLERRRSGRTSKRGRKFPCRQRRCICLPARSELWRVGPASRGWGARFALPEIGRGRRIILKFF